MADTTAPRGALPGKPAFSPTTSFGLGYADGSLASPSLVDIDNDGDLDAFVGNGAGNTLVFLNTGTASNPAFAAATTNPYGLGDVGGFASPSLVDIDNDGDLDAFVGNGDGNTLVFLNTGTASSPAFAVATINPYGLSDAGNYASPSFADIDNDGDLDAFIGNKAGNTLVYMNTGTASNPAFAAASTNPYGLGDVGAYASPSLVDIDGDGDLDVLIGNWAGNTRVYLNTGTVGSPAFSGISIDPGDAGGDASPNFVDIDNDGDLDALIGNSQGNTLIFLNTGTASIPGFAAAITNPYGLGDVGDYASPSFVDIDGDGDLDAFVGNKDGNTLVYLNTGTASSPGFAAATTNPYGLGNVGARASPNFVDIDGDGDLDALIGNGDGKTLVSLNTGTASSPAFAAATTNPYGLRDVGYSANPSLVDIDGDGDLDALIGNGDGKTLVYLNTGTASSPAFAAASNPYGLVYALFNRYHASPSFVDIDGDGDLDAFIGISSGATLVCLNTGTDSSPAFAAPSTDPYGLGTVNASRGGPQYASPSFVDIDGDGDLDAFIGSRYGSTLVFINTANPVAPVSSTTANGTYRVGNVITLTVAFNENVIVNTSGGVPTLALETGAIDGFATYVSGSGTSTLTFRYTVKAGDSSADLDFLSTSALTLNRGTIQDAAGNNAILTLAAPGTTGSLAANAALVIDGINDILNGGAGADTLNGGVGADTMTGGQANDLYYVDNAGDKVVETDASALGGTDTVYSYLTAYTLTSNVERGVIKTSGAANLTGNALANNLYGGAGDNTLSALAGNDYLNGGAGQDKLVGGLGADTMVGGDGGDFYYVDDAGDKVVETEAQAAVGGVDTVYSYLAAYTLTGNVERGVIKTSGVANLTGNTLANNLYGGTGNNKLMGAAGDDYLVGDAGNDTLLGDAGNDWLAGGAGTDRLTGGLGADSFVIDSAGGRDVILDFSSSQGDKIILRSNLNGSGITDGANALAHMLNASSNAVLDMGNGNVVILTGVQAADLTAADFLFF